MNQFVLPLDPSVWNVLKFLALALVITPILEILLQSLITSRVTLAVRNRKQMQMFSSRLGILALHSKYAGVRRNRFWLVCCAVFILSTQLLLEYSFNTAQLDRFESVPVSEGPDHHTRYYGANNTFIDDEPTRFLDSLATACIEGPLAFNRTRAENPDHPLVKNQFSYNATFRIRAPYMRAADSSVACGVSKKEQNVSIIIPDIVEDDGGYEGFESGCEVSAFTSYRSWYDRLLQEKLRLTGSFDFEGVTHDVFTGDSAVCMREANSELSDGFCVISNGTEIAVGRSVAAPTNSSLICIGMFMSGEGMQQLHEPGRKVRFLAYLAETKVFDLDWASFTEKLVPKSQLEHTALVAFVVANEEGVVGVEGPVSRRNIVLPEKRNVTTVSVLAFVPATMLLVTALILGGCDVLTRMNVAKIERNEKGVTPGAFSHSRVNMSIEWIRERVAADLTRSGLRECAKKDVRVRLVRHGDKRRLQVLPDGIGENDVNIYNEEYRS